MDSIAKAPTKLIDVANAAGVSITTASFVLNGRGNVSNLIRNRVLSAASELDYKPRRKNKVSSRTECYAVIANISLKWGFTWSFYEPILNGLKAGFENTEWTAVVVPFDDNMSPQKLLSYLRSIDCRMVFILECANAEIVQLLERNNLKVILLLDSLYQNRFYTLCQDDIQASYEATCHLIEHGHRKIWLVDRTFIHRPHVATDRFIGYKKALDERGVAYEEKWHVTLAKIEPLQLGGIANRIKSEPAETRPTALVMHGDYLANKLMMHLVKAQIRVPEDLSIVAHGDVLEYSPSDPFAISTMRLDTYAIGHLAAQTMLNRLKNQKSDTRQTLKLRSKFVDRGSIKSLT